MSDEHSGFDGFAEMLVSGPRTTDQLSDFLERAFLVAKFDAFRHNMGSRIGAYDELAIDDLPPDVDVREWGVVEAVGVPPPQVYEDPKISQTRDVADRLKRFVAQAVFWDAVSTLASRLKEPGTNLVFVWVVPVTVRIADDRKSMSASASWAIVPSRDIRQRSSSGTEQSETVTMQHWRGVRFEPQA